MDEHQTFVAHPGIEPANLWSLVEHLDWNPDQIYLAWTTGRASTLDMQHQSVDSGFGTGVAPIFRVWTNLENWTNGKNIGTKDLSLATKMKASSGCQWTAHAPFLDPRLRYFGSCQCLASDSSNTVHTHEEFSCLWDSAETNWLKSLLDVLQKPRDVRYAERRTDATGGAYSGHRVGLVLAGRKPQSRAARGARPSNGEQLKKIHVQTSIQFAVVEHNFLAHSTVWKCWGDRLFTTQTFSFLV